MKKLLFILTVLSCFIPRNAKALDEDKVFHFAVGFFSTGFVYGILSEQYCTYDFRGNEKCEYVIPVEQKILYSLLFSFALGAMKELADSRPGGTGFSWSDLGFGMLGAGSAILVFQIPF